MQLAAGRITNADGNTLFLLSKRNLVLSVSTIANVSIDNSIGAGLSLLVAGNIVAIRYSGSTQDGTAYQFYSEFKPISDTDFAMYQDSLSLVFYVLLRSFSREQELDSDMVGRLHNAISDTLWRRFSYAIGQTYRAKTTIGGHLYREALEVSRAIVLSVKVDEFGRPRPKATLGGTHELRLEEGFADDCKRLPALTLAFQYLDFIGQRFA